jgi:sugar lactone lactonase YvrE
MKKLYTIMLLALFGLGLKAQIISTVAGNGITGFSGDGAIATAAELNGPIGVALDAAGNIYIGEQGNHRIRKLTVSTGIITTVAGNGIGSFFGDGGAATSAALNNPNGVALDALGNIFIADYSNNRIRKVTVSTGIITTVAGNGTAGFSGDGAAATAATLYYPRGVALDTSGNIFITEYGNNRIRKVTVSTGIITTVAGNGTAGYSGDGGVATAAQLFQPTSVALDASGNIFIADYYNMRIRKVTASTGIITTVAGNGGYGYGGDGGVATATELYFPWGVALDASGNIFIADYYNQRIRKVTVSTGIITTVAGNGTAGYSGDGGVATAAELYGPVGVVLDASENIFVAEATNGRIRKVNVAVGIEQFAISNEQINIYPNPANAIIVLRLAQGDNAEIKITNVLGEEVFHISNVASLTSQIDVSNFQNGIYFVSVKTTEGTTTKKIIVQH